MPLNLSDLVLDSEFQSLLPAGSESERTELVANIRSDGRFTDPIIVWLNHGIVVDGQTRFDIWLNELERSDDISPEIIEKPFASKDEVKAWMIRRQNGRRNWSQSQRARMAAELATLRNGRHSVQALQNCGASVAAAAEEMHVSPRLVQSAKNVKEKGSKPLDDAVKNGHVKVTDADHIVDLPKSEQTKAVHAVQNGKAKTVTEAAKPKSAKKPKKPPTEVEREPGDETESEATQSIGDGQSEKTAAEVPKHLQAVADSLKEIRSAINAIGKVREQIRKICEAHGGNKLAKVWSDTERMCEQISVNLKTYRFWAQCPECKITDKHTKPDANCKMCRGHGWIAKTNGLSDFHKTWLRERGVEC